MYPIDPGVDWGEMIIYGSEQSEQFEPLYSRKTPEGSTITRWLLTEKDKAAIAAGRSVYLRILTFGQPLQPVSLWVEGTLDVDA